MSLGRLQRTVDLAHGVGARMVVAHPPFRYRAVILRHEPLSPPWWSRRSGRGASPYHRWIETELESYQDGKRSRSPSRTAQAPARPAPGQPVRHETRSET